MMDKFKCIKSTLFFLFGLLLTGCDAMLNMTYTVENKTKSEIQVFVPNFPIDSVLSIYGKVQDTILIIKPEEEIIVGIQNKIDFPWATKNIYKNTPGICGLKILNNDIATDIGCDKTEWKYKKRNSKLKIN